MATLLAAAHPELAFSEGINGLLDEVEEFLTGARTGADLGGLAVHIAAGSRPAPATVRCRSRAR